MKKYIPSYYSICASTIFLSAFLLFQIQPLISKHILPWFGGGAMVWITALFFFMSVLLGGYLYVLLLSRYTLFIQKFIHSGLMILVSGFLLYHSLVWTSGITPIQESFLLSTDPVLAILTVLTISIGAPFFLLSTTSSLLQLWYGESTGNEPFSLYAISNVGSLLGLLSYPFFFEPFFPTPLQGILWTGGFTLYIILLIGVIFQTKDSAQSQKKAPEIISETKRSLSIAHFSQWVIVASIPVMVMLTSTSFISGFVAAMPFIWIVPLALYLISFIVSFRGGERSIGSITLLMVVVSSLAGLGLMSISSTKTAPLVLLALWVSVFTIAHYCHEWLYEHRPVPSKLPWFYTAMSIGGVLGSSLVLLSNLFILKSPYEYIGILILMMGVALYQFSRLPRDIAILSKKQILGLSVLVSIVVSVFIYTRIRDTENIVIAERNFFGAKKILDRDSGTENIRMLAHEMTAHGYEYQSPELIGKTTSYYTENSGIARTINVLKEQNSPDGITVAVLGLGAGVLASYCEVGDTFTFFEIDPEVITLANEYFTFLKGCADKKILLGDARKLLDDEALSISKKYDLIIIDAYADDAAPAHLMTVEAVGLYQKLLKDDGAIAIHISSRYLDLLPVVSGLAKRNDLSGRFYKDTNPGIYGVPSLWTILSNNNELLIHQKMSSLEDLSTIEPLYWTDTKNALLPIIRFW